MPIKTKFLTFSICLAFSSTALAQEDFCRIGEENEPLVQQANDDIDKVFESSSDLSALSEASEVSVVASDLSFFFESLGDIGAGVGLAVGMYDLAKGIQDGNSGEIINGSMSIASVVVPELVSEVVAEVAGAAAGEIAGGILAWGFAEGMDIYHGIKLDELISDSKINNQKLEQNYAGVVNRIYQSLAETRRIISGNAEEEYKLTVENFGKITVNLAQRQINEIAFLMINRELAKVSAIRDKNRSDSALTDPLFFLQRSMDEPVYDKAHFAQSLGRINSALKQEYYPKDFFAAYYSDAYAVSRHYMTDPYSTHLDGTPLTRQELTQAYANPFLRSRGLQGDIFPLTDWTHHHWPAIVEVVQKMMDSNGQLAEDFQKVAKLVAQNYPELQREMVKQYNKVILNQAAWIKFGEEVLANIDYRKEKDANGTLWAVRVLTPLVDPFFEMGLDKKIIEQVNVSVLINKFIIALAKSNVRITDEKAWHVVQKYSDSLGLPWSVTHNMSESFNEARKWTADTLLTRHDIKPIQFTAEEIARHNRETRQMLDNGTLKHLLDTAIHDYLFNKVLPDFRGDKRLPEMLVAFSSQHWAYQYSVLFILDKYKSKSDLNEEMTLRELQLELAKNHQNYMRNSASVTEEFNWIRFRVLGETKNQLDRMIAFISHYTKTGGDIVTIEADYAARQAQKHSQVENMLRNSNVHITEADAVAQILQYLDADQPASYKNLLTAFVKMRESDELPYLYNQTQDMLAGIQDYLKSNATYRADYQLIVSSVLKPGQSAPDEIQDGYIKMLLLSAIVEHYSHQHPFTASVAIRKLAGANHPVHLFVAQSIKRSLAERMARSKRMTGHDLLPELIADLDAIGADLKRDPSPGFRQLMRLLKTIATHGGIPNLRYTFDVALSNLQVYLAGNQHYLAIVDSLLLNKSKMSRTDDEYLKVALLSTIVEQFFKDNPDDLGQRVVDRLAASYAIR